MAPPPRSSTTAPSSATTSSRRSQGIQQPYPRQQPTGRDRPSDLSPPPTAADPSSSSSAAVNASGVNNAGPGTASASAAASSPLQLFIDPMHGTPLCMYVDKDVEDKDAVVELITKHGGSVSPGYSGVPYILVDPLKTSGQNLWRQYVNKKGKVVLSARWVHECIKAGQLQTFQTNWADCKVIGNEIGVAAQQQQQQQQQPVASGSGLGRTTVSPVTAASASTTTPRRRSTRQATAPPVAASTPPIHVDTRPHPVSAATHPQALHPGTHHPHHPQHHAPPPGPPPPPPHALQAIPPGLSGVDPQIVHPHFSYHVYGAGMQPMPAPPPPPPQPNGPGRPGAISTGPVGAEASAQPPQAWQTSGSIAPQQTRLTHRSAGGDGHVQGGEGTAASGEGASSTAGTSTPTPSGAPGTSAAAPGGPGPGSHTLTHLLHRVPSRFGEEAWASAAVQVYNPHGHPVHPGHHPHAQHPGAYEYRYRHDQGPPPPPPPHPHAWGPPAYYESAYDQTYEATYIADPDAGHPTPPPPRHMADASSSSAVPAVNGAATDTGVVDGERPRGRKRARVPSQPAPPAASLVVNRNPPARSPTPPTRVVKSTYGGNLFTAEDVLYLKRYIDYCQEQGLVLSLREICERIAIKAPHHTFYSWRRYCNKHQIRLGGYLMNTDRSGTPNGGGEAGNGTNTGGGGGGADEHDIEEEESLARQQQPHHPHSHAAALQPHHPPFHMMHSTGVTAAGSPRNKSPTPPRALFRSTTGKGVAFTDDDVRFLVRFMEYRKSQGKLDMVAFWKEVAAKAPHHSRASWMKYWRRHKHELARSEGDDPLPRPPEKKMRYSKADDILLARYFSDKPEGTSDKVFQAFGRQYPHHPWKGWQEHHRIHKAKIDHYIQLLSNGESLDDAGTGEE